MNRLASVAILAFLNSTALLATETFTVDINTTPLSASSGYLAFDFIGGTPVVNNAVTIINFSTDGTLGTLTPSGSAFGTIAKGGTGTLNDAQFFNELLQAISYGNAISFDLTLTTNFGPTGTPDVFSLYLLDSGQNPHSTSDPSGADSLFTIALDSASPSPKVFTSASATATVTPASLVPEPENFCLLAGGLLLLALVSQVRRLKFNATSNAGDRR